MKTTTKKKKLFFSQRTYYPQKLYTRFEPCTVQFVTRNERKLSFLLINLTF